MPKVNINNHTGTTVNNDHKHCYRHDELSSGDHICILYETLPEMVESVIPFISSGIELYHKCIYITDSDGHDKVLTALTTGGLNTTACLKTQQLLIQSSADFYTPAGCFEPDNVIGCLLKEAEKAAREGYGCLRVTGDMSWALRGINSTGRLLEYESRLNALPDSSPLITLCQYDITRFDGETLKGVLRTHPKLIWQGEVLENHYYIPTADFLSDKRSQYEVKHWLNNLKVWKNRQLALEESEARYRTIFESTGTATCILNKHWQITLANSHWEKITGYPIHEIEGLKHLQDFLHPEDIEEFNSKFQPANYKAGIAPDNHEVRIITKKGDLRNVF
jgi:PAS domain S-box-containing protein